MSRGGYDPTIHGDSVILWYKQRHQLPKVSPKRMLLVPQSYGLIISREAIGKKRITHVGTTGLASCVGVVIYSSETDPVLVAHVDYTTDTVALDYKVLTDVFRSQCKTSKSVGIIMYNVNDKDLYTIVKSGCVCVSNLATRQIPGTDVLMELKSKMCSFQALPGDDGTPESTYRDCSNKGAKLYKLRHNECSIATSRWTKH